jgi:F0F1-type ATP synthase assembly protein I
VEEDPGSGRHRKLMEYMRYSASGMQLFAACGLGALLGWWLDGKAGTGPLLLVLFTFLGFGAGFYTLYRELFGRRR